MVTPEQANEVAESLLDEPRKEIRREQQKRHANDAAERKRRESPLIPAVIAATGTLVAAQYIESGIICIALGAAAGTLFGWAARRS